MKEGNKIKIGRILADMKPHSTFEICERITGYNPLNGGGSLLAIAARVQDWRNKGCIIPQAKKDPKIKGMYWYQMTYISDEAREILGLVPCPAIVEEGTEQELLFDMR